MNNTEVTQKINHLKQLQGVLDGDQYRLAAATICTEYCLKEIYSSDIKISRSALMNRVNRILHKHNIDRVSYNFFRKFI